MGAMTEHNLGIAIARPGHMDRSDRSLAACDQPPRAARQRIEDMEARRAGSRLQTGDVRCVEGTRRRSPSEEFPPIRAGARDLALIHLRRTRPRRRKPPRQRARSSRSGAPCREAKTACAIVYARALDAAGWIEEAHAAMHDAYVWIAALVEKIADPAWRTPHERLRERRDPRRRCQRGCALSVIKVDDALLRLPWISRIDQLVALACSPAAPAPTTRFAPPPPLVAPAADAAPSPRAAAPALRFTVTFPASLSATPLDGRLSVILAKDGHEHPRNPGLGSRLDGQGLRRRRPRADARARPRPSTPPLSATRSRRSPRSLPATTSSRRSFTATRPSPAVTGTR